MLNQVALVGRITEIKENEIAIAVSRNFKNAEGVYDTDIIDITIYEGIYSQVLEYCNKGNVIGIRGRIQVIDNNMKIVAEKVSVLSSKKPEKSKKDDEGAAIVCE